MNDTIRHKAKVVIPLYRSTLDECERKSLFNNLGVLKSWPAVILLPHGIEAPAETEGLEVLRVSDEWLGSKNGIAGYNRMMMSAEFYRLFDDCEYILICQTDAWIFRDELSEWCDRGYDYAGAPWPKRPVYDNFIIDCWLRLRKKLCGGGRILRQDKFDKTGNGGLSLRRVSAHIAACEKYASRVEEFLGRGVHLYNEDVFWATVPREFRYPSVAEAVRFSIDMHPEYCYELAGRRLPFGCHAWSKPRYRKFWTRFIP